MARMEIITVEGGSELKDFIDLPWRIYAEYSNWVPPLRKEVRRLLDPRRHPFGETWVPQKGMTFMRGPLNPSINYEVGLLIEGFNYPPALMMAYNPPYYPGLVESCGFTKEKDLLTFLIDGDYRLPEWMDHLAERIPQKRGIHIRRSRPKDPNSGVTLIRGEL